MSRIDASTTAIGGLIQVYKYEPFSNSFSLASGTDVSETLSFTQSSPELYQFLTNPTARDVSFSSAAGPNISYANDLSLVVVDLSGTTALQTLAYDVRMSAGRFLSPASGTSFSFYKNEPLSVTFPSGLNFVGSIAIQRPVTIPTLPVGVSWQSTVDASTYALVGTPTLQAGATSYNIIGTSPVGGKTISTRATITVNPERMLVDLSGSSNVSGLTIGSAISPRVETIRVPSYGGIGKIRYTWTPALPTGFSFLSATGSTFANGGITQDTSSTIILTGTPTSNTIASFSNVPYAVTLTATRTFSPFLTSNVTYTFSANECVLFDTPNMTPLFVGLPVTASASSNSFKARTQFADSSIVSIFSPDLRSDLSLVFLSNQQRADLSGTPSSALSGSYRIRAINGNGISGEITTTIASSVDAVSFDYSVTPTTDVCASFILGRNLSNTSPGYYGGPYKFRASALSGGNVTMATSSLTGTGLSLTNTGSNEYTLTGTPAATLPLTTLLVTATASGTAVTKDTSMNFSILPDKFTFNTVSLSFVQNFPITPVQFRAVPRSGLTVVSYFSTNVPTGLTLSTAGLLSGTLLTDTSSTLTVFASTGLTTDSSSYPYSVRPDSMVLFTPSNSYTYLAGGDVDIPVTGVSYSGTTVSNFQFSNLNPQYGLVMNATTGVLDGVFSDSIPPADVLPSSSNFYVTANANLLTGSLPVQLTTANPIVLRSYLARNQDPYATTSASILTSDSNLLTWSNTTNVSNVAGYQISEIQRKNADLDSNVVLATAIILSSRDLSGNLRPGRLYRATSNGSVFSTIETNKVQNISSLANKPGTSTWWGLGANEDISLGLAVLTRSDDDGLTWSDASAIQVNVPNPLRTRDNATSLSSTFTNYYTTAGGVLRYKNGVLLAGGSGYATPTPTGIGLLRSADEGASWSRPTDTSGGGSLSLREVAMLSLDASRWILAGSTLYNAGDLYQTYTVGDNATTLFSSDDDGDTWTAGIGGFTFGAYDVAYANNTWLATGVQADQNIFIGGIDYKPQLKYSLDGINWSNVTQINDAMDVCQNKLVPPIGIGPMLYDGSNWNVVVNTGGQARVYVHPATEDIGNPDWTMYTDSSGLSGLLGGSSVPYTSWLPAVYTRTGSPISPTLTFSTSSTTGPTIVSPSSGSLLFYQYMPLSPVVFSATGVGTVYFFVNSNSLPLGLSWNPLTQTISGASVRLGTANFTVYARDLCGVTAFPVTTTTIIPRIIRKQDGAGAYTSLLRQYTVVNGALNSRDNLVYPTQERMLGEFMAPPAPDSTTPSNCKC